MRKILATVLLMLGPVVPIMAHHPFASEYDWKKPATLTGTISKVEWMSPHVRLMVNGKIDTKDQTNAAATTWTVELGSPNELTQLGWKLATLKAGDRIIIDGWLGHTASSHTMNAKAAQFADGRALSAASSFFNIEPTIDVVSSTRGGSSAPATGTVSGPASASLK